MGAGAWSKIFVLNPCNGEQCSLLCIQGQAIRQAKTRKVMMMNVFGNVKTAKHSYEVGTIIDGKITKVEVHANSSAQASKIVAGKGLEVRDVNMVG